MFNADVAIKTLQKHYEGKLVVERYVGVVKLSLCEDVKVGFELVYQDRNPDRDETADLVEMLLRALQGPPYIRMQDIITGRISHQILKGERNEREKI